MIKKKIKQIKDSIPLQFLIDETSVLFYFNGFKNIFKNEAK